MEALVARTCLSALTLALLLASSLPAWAQAELWLAPTLGQLMTRADYGLTLYPDQHVRNVIYGRNVSRHSERAALRGEGQSDRRGRSEERRVGKEWRSRWSPYH